jgi:hypothetical protein
MRFLATPVRTVVLLLLGFVLGIFWIVTSTGASIKQIIFQTFGLSETSKILSVSNSCVVDNNKGDTSEIFFISCGGIF